MPDTACFAELDASWKWDVPNSTSKCSPCAILYRKKKKSTAQEILFWCAESAPGLFRAQVEVVGFYWCKSDLPSSCHFFIALPWILDVFSSIYHRTQDHVHVWSKWSSKRFRVLQSVSFRKRNWWGHQITWRKLCLFSRKSKVSFSTTLGELKSIY